MKRNVLLSVLSGLILLIVMAALVVAQTTSTKTVIIDGMMCGNCVNKVKTALSALDGVQSADVVVGKAKLTLDKEVSDDSIKNAIAKAGYKVTAISSEGQASDSAGNQPEAAAAANKKTDKPISPQNLELTGILIDDDCKAVASPEKHTLSCLNMPECLASGLGVDVKQADGTYKFYKFDTQGHNLAKSQVVDQTSRKNNIAVLVKGSWDGQILTLTSISEIAAQQSALTQEGNTTTAAPALRDIKGHWAEKPITKFIAQGYIKGYDDGSFKPDDPISRAELVALCNKVFKLTAKADISFSDVAQHSALADDVARARAAGYISGYSDGTFKPDKAVSRTEAAVILAKLLKLDAAPGNDAIRRFKDYKQVPIGGQGAWNALAKAEYFGGYPNQTIAPNNSISRAEAVAIIYKATNQDCDKDNCAGKCKVNMK